MEGCAGEEMLGSAGGVQDKQKYNGNDVGTKEEAKITVEHL